MNTLADLPEVHVSRTSLGTMLAFAQTMVALQNHHDYVRAVAAALPDTAQAMQDEDAILMGFDFHLTDEGPKLIEINNNAGGLFTGDAGWMPQDDGDIWSDSLTERLLSMFPASWQHIVILDEDIQSQYMLPEMQAYAALLRQDGRQVDLCSPEDLELRHDGLYVGNEKVDGIYNRHCDFYLETAAMAHIRQALMAGQVRVNPYPRSYALLGHKARMVDWWRAGLLESCMPQAELEQVRAVVPEIHLMSDMDLEKLWKERKQWVFKPAARHGGKGVVLGKGMSRKRFESLDQDDTVVQKFVPASVVEHDGVAYKFDMRLYMHGERLIALAGRLWRGQVTNFREPGSGWTKITVVDD